MTQISATQIPATQIPATQSYQLMSQHRKNDDVIKIASQVANKSGLA